MHAQVWSELGLQTVPNQIPILMNNNNENNNDSTETNVNAYRDRTV